ncbi:radical SAM protein [Candidatus Fermentibacteria bacterium]|nr:radical SAM protein [Candidatus Fermentibacteria bacterium]
MPVLLHSEPKASLVPSHNAYAHFRTSRACHRRFSGLVSTRQSREVGQRLILRRALSRFVRRSHRFPYMRLKSSKRFLTVRMDVTNKCNLRCKMCPMRLSDQDPDRIWHDVDPDLFEKIRKQVFPRAKVVGLSCGAEPFCCEDLPRYLQQLWQADVPVTELVTNGTLMTDRSMLPLLDYPPTSIFVSVDGADPRTHARIRGGCDLELLLSNVRGLQEAKRRRGQRFPQLCVGVTLQRSNYDQLPGIVEIASDLGAVSVGVVPLVPYQGLDVEDQAVDMQSPEIRGSLRNARRTAEARGIDLVVPPTSSRSDTCPFLDSWVYIDPDGRVDPCPHWNVSEPLGNLTDQSFEEIWNGEAYSRLRKGHRQGELHGNCLLCPVMGSGERAEIPKV